MPHLSELQRKHADDGVTIIGVTREDPNNSLEDVRKMTADKGDTMDYTVAFDNGGKTYDAYMKASGQRGIPTAFIVDKTGHIAFIGHPMAMDLPLAMVADGTWDPATSPKEIAELQTMSRGINMGARNVTAETAPGLLEQIAEFKRRWPSQAETIRGAEYTILTAAGKHAEAGAVGRDMVADAIAAEDAGMLNQIAWGIVDPAVEKEHRDVSLALWAAEVAANLTEHEDPAILDTLARAHFWIGGHARALELQRKAVALVEADPKRWAGFAEGLEAALDEYAKLVKE